MQSHDEVIQLQAVIDYSWELDPAKEMDWY